MPEELILLKGVGFLEEWEGNCIDCLGENVLDTLHWSLHLVLLTTLRSWHCHSRFTDRKMEVQRG